MFSLGQLLALFAILASAINAQCALSCSLLLEIRSVPKQGVTQASPAGHACCSKGRGAANKQQEQPIAPCPHPLPSISNAVELSPIQGVAAPDWVAEVVGRASAPLAFLEYASHRRQIESSGLPPDSAFRVLRV